MQQVPLNIPRFMLLLVTCVYVNIENVFAQNISFSSAPNRACNTKCPSGFQCFNNTAVTVRIMWGYNGQVCNGQTPGQCYGGEPDPLGSNKGPRQFPQTVIEGDTVFFERSVDMLDQLNVYNVTRGVFYGCSTGGQQIHPATVNPLQVPEEFLKPPGIKYFISQPLFPDCAFGIRLELYVRSREQPGCVNPVTPSLGVCSGKGFCISNASTFFTRNFSCLCCDSYKGEYCEEFDECDLSPCMNGATCSDRRDGLNEGFNCTCLPGYTGEICDTNIDECASGPCQNKGLCVDEINRYSCLCSEDTEGDNCEVVIANLCHLNPCANGGTCKRSAPRRRNYTCICPPGFTGRNCTVNITSLSLLSSSTQFAVTSTILGTTLIYSSGMVTHAFSSMVMNSTGATTSSFSSSKLPVKTSSMPASLSSLPSVSLFPVDSPELGSMTASSADPALTSLVRSVSSPRLTRLLSLPGTSSPQSTRTLSVTQKSSSIPVTTSSADPTLTSLVPVVSSSRLTQLLSLPGTRSPQSTRTLSVTQKSSSIPDAPSTSNLLPNTTKAVLTSLPSKTSVQSLSSAATFSLTSVGPTSPNISLDSFVTHSPSRSAVVPSTVNLTETTIVSKLDSVTSTVRTSSDPSAHLSQPLSASTSVTASTSLPSPLLSSTHTSSLTSSVSSSLSSALSLSSSSLASVPTTLVVTISSSNVLSTVSSKLSFSQHSTLSKTPSLSPFISLSSKPTTKSVSATRRQSDTVSTMFDTATIKPSPTVMSTMLVSSTVLPIPPLRNQTCAHNPCNSSGFNGTCVSEMYSGYKFRCECPYPSFGPNCVTEYDLHFPAFRSGSYVEHKEIAFYNSDVNQIDMTFQTSVPDGLLLFAADHKERGDFIQLRVVNGKLEFRFDPGDSLVVITSIERVDNGEPTSVTIRYVSDVSIPFGTLQVNDSAELVGRVQGDLRGIQLYDKWYIGGVPEQVDMVSKTKGSAAPSPSFVGSIRDVQVNGEAIRISEEEAYDWYNINEGDMPPCDKSPCQNGGTCKVHDDNPHEYECMCPPGYNGTNCQLYASCGNTEVCRGGECVRNDTDPGEFICLCPLHKAGAQCETGINITVPLFTIVHGYSSFLKYKLPKPEDALNSFDVSFHFKVDNSSTSWNDSLLVYMAQNKFQAGGDDFFAVGLKNNRVVVQFNLGSGTVFISSEPDMSKEWHVVVAGRQKRQGYLYVDSDYIGKHSESPPALTGLNIHEPLYIGGIPDSLELPNVLEFQSKGFHGSLHDLAVRFAPQTPFIPLTFGSSGDWSPVEGRNVGDANYDACAPQSHPQCHNGGNCTRQGATFVCSCPDHWAGLYCNSRQVPCFRHNPCRNGECRPDGMNITCDCPLGKTGSHCELDVIINTPLFQEFSYMLFQKRNIRLETKILIRFKPATLHGILFYVSHSENSASGDFLSIVLHNGFVELRYDLGKGVAIARSNTTVTQDTWHTVRVDRNRKNGSLFLNSDNPVSVESTGSAIALDVESNFFLGGVRNLEYVNPGSVRQDFTGCIEYLEVNNVEYSLANDKALEGRNIASCDPSNVNN